MSKYKKLMKSIDETIYRTMDTIIEDYEERLSSMEDKYSSLDSIFKKMISFEERENKIDFTNIKEELIDKLNLDEWIKKDGLFNNIKKSRHQKILEILHTTSCTDGLFNAFINLINDERENE